MPDGGDGHAGRNALLIEGDPHSALANYHCCEFSHQSHRGAGNFQFYPRSAEFFNVVDQHDFKNLNNSGDQMPSCKSDDGCGQPFLVCGLGAKNVCPAPSCLDSNPASAAF